MVKPLGSMRRISEETLKEVFRLWPEPRLCCLCQSSQNIQLHHNLIMGGRQSDNPKTILPVCDKCHRNANKQEVREQLDHLMLNQMTEAEAKDLSKIINYDSYKRFLYEKYQQKKR